MKLVEKKIKAPKHNTWTLTVNYMHGDADAYTDEAIEFETEEDIKKGIIVAEAMKKLEDDVNPWINYDIEELDDYFEIMEDLYCGDSTRDCDGPASIESISVIKETPAGESIAVTWKLEDEDKELIKKICKLCKG